MDKQPKTLSKLRDILEEDGYKPINFMGYRLEYKGCEITLANDVWFIKTKTEHIGCSSMTVVNRVRKLLGVNKITKMLDNAK